MLLHYNKGLVRQFVWRCKHMGTEISFGELVLAGDDALLKAALAWDPRKGTRFSTYAFQRVNRSEAIPTAHSKGWPLQSCCDFCVVEHHNQLMILYGSAVAQLGIPANVQLRLLLHLNRIINRMFICVLFHGGLSVSLHSLIVCIYLSFLSFKHLSVQSSMQN